MGKSKKTVYKRFTYLQCDDFAAYLSKMASEGWHFKEWKWGLVFEKGEPEDSVYAVEVFINGEGYDLRPEDHTLSFAEYCEAAGWKLVDAKGKFCIFKQARADSVDILTREERLQNASKFYAKENIPVAICILLFLSLLLRIFPLSRFIDTVFDGTVLFGSFCQLCYIVFCLFKSIWLYAWKQKAKKRYASGETKILSGASEVSWNWIFGIFFMILTIPMLAYSDPLFTIFIITAIAIILLTSILLNLFRPSNTTNFTIVIVLLLVVYIATFGVSFASIEFSHQDEPNANISTVIYEESIDENGELQDTRYGSDSSIFGSKQTCQVTYENAEYSYVLYKTDKPWLLDAIWKSVGSTVNKTEATDCAALWNAETALQYPYCNYYVRFRNGVMILCLEEELTTQQADALCVLLGLG